MTIAKTLANALVRLAARLDPPEPPAPAVKGADPDGDAATRIVNELLLRDALGKALGRYTPLRLPAQA